MKYWGKLNGDCGTMDDDGYVPDSIEVSESVYMDFVNSQPIVEYVAVVVEYENIETGKTLKLRKVK